MIHEGMTEVATYFSPEEPEVLEQIIRCQYCNSVLTFSFPENENGEKELDDEMLRTGWKHCRDGYQCGRHEIIYR